jgi:hypothetical protein
MVRRSARLLIIPEPELSRFRIVPDCYAVRSEAINLSAGDLLVNAKFNREVLGRNWPKQLDHRKSVFIHQ